LAVHKFVTYLLRHLPTYLQPGPTWGSCPEAESQWGKRSTHIHTHTWKKAVNLEVMEWLVGWSLTSLFSTNTAISVSETKGQGWRVILLSGEGKLAIH